MEKGVNFVWNTLYFHVRKHVFTAVSTFENSFPTPVVRAPPVYAVRDAVNDFLAKNYYLHAVFKAHASIFQTQI